MEQLKPDATAVYVAAGQAVGAIQEAIEAEIPLIVAVAEHVPVHDMLRVTAAIIVIVVSYSLISRYTQSSKPNLNHA